MTWGSKPGERRGGRAKGTPNKRTAGIMAPPPSPAVVASVRALDELRFGAKLLRDLMIDAYDRLQQGKAKPDELIARIKDYLWAQEKVVPYEDAKLVSIKGGDGLDGSAPFECTERTATPLVIAPPRSRRSWPNKVYVGREGRPYPAMSVRNMIAA
jgi:hypothetical protein